MHKSCGKFSFWVAFFSMVMNFWLWGEPDSTDNNKVPSLEWGGFIQGQFIHSSKAVDSFRIRRARLKLSGKVADPIFFKLQLAPVKRTALLDAQVDIRFFPYMNLEFGQYKIPFSLENLTSSSSLDFINRSLAVENLCPGRDMGSSGRDIGISVYGQVAKFKYTLGFFNGSGINRLDNNEHKDLSGRVVYLPFDFLSMGFSLYRGKHTLGAGQPESNRNRNGLELQLVKGRFVLKSEYIFARDHELERQGMYVQGAYALLPGTIELLLRYDSLNKDKSQQGQYHKAIDLGLNWHITEKSKFQINLELHNEEPYPGQDLVLLALFQAGF